jgi:formyl-CoA transferase
VSLPLAGIRVVDLSRNIAGPLCTMVLGDLGADVIKVERPDGGDESRNHATESGVSPYFSALNRNKRSICLDLKAPEGTRALAGLLARSDVLVDNFRPGALARLGFGDERLRQDFPDLLVAHISGFGPVGPWAQATAYDHIIQGFAGLMSLTGPPGEGGYRTNTSVADVVTGLFTATALAASLRGRSGVAGAASDGPPAHLGSAAAGAAGDVIDVSLLGGLLNALCYQSATYLTTGVAPRPTGNQHPYIVPYGTYRTSDGLLNVCIGNNRLFARFCATLGLPDLIDDPRFGSNSDRVQHRDALNGYLEPALAARPTLEWSDRLRDEGVPVGPVHTLAEALEHPQVDALRLITEVDDGVGGQFRQLGPPFASDRLSDVVRRRPPLLGEHTQQILAELEDAGALRRQDEVR